MLTTETKLIMIIILNSPRNENLNLLVESNS